MAGVLAAGPIGIFVFVALFLAGLSALASLALTVAIQLVVIGSIVVIGIMVQTDEEKNGSGMQDQTPGQRELPETWIFHSRRESSERQYRSALIARRTGQTASIARVLTEIGSDVHQCADHDALLETVKVRQDRWSLMVFDIDAAPDLDSAVMDLMDFRTSCPDVPVILLSGDVTRDDFSGHRRPIGDITLRKPVFRGRLIEAVRCVGLDLEPAYHDI